MRNGYSDTCAQKPCACSEQDKVTMAGRKETEPDVLPDPESDISGVEADTESGDTNVISDSSSTIARSLFESLRSPAPSALARKRKKYFHCVMSSISFLTVFKKEKWVPL